jgi:hypothetical protein
MVLLEGNMRKLNEPVPLGWLVHACIALLTRDKARNVAASSYDDDQVEKLL